MSPCIAPISGVLSRLPTPVLNYPVSSYLIDRWFCFYLSTYAPLCTSRDARPNTCQLTPCAGLVLVFYGCLMSHCTTRNISAKLEKVADSAHPQCPPIMSHDSVAPSRCSSSQRYLWSFVEVRELGSTYSRLHGIRHLEHVNLLPTPAPKSFPRHPLIFSEARQL